MSPSPAATPFSGALAELRRRLEFLEGLAGPGRMAERMITAFRDGVPPPAVHPITVGNPDLFATLQATVRGRQPIKHRALVIEGRSGDGLSHCLQWTREEAASRGFAALALTSGFALEPDRMQSAVFEKARVGERNLIDSLSDPHTKASRAAAAGAVRKLARELTAGGLQCLQLLFEALNRRDHNAVLELVGWMRGDQMPSAWRRRNGLPARALLATDLHGLASAVTTLLTMFGITGLLISIDDSSAAEIAHFGDQFQAPGITVIGTWASGSPHNRDLNVRPLGSTSRQTLAILIRDLHVHAYDWKRPSSIAAERLNKWVLAAPSGTTRDFVRYVVGRLDAAHAAA